MPNGELNFELDGRVVESAEVFYSDRASAFLVVAPELSSPILLSTRTGSVESIHPMKVVKRGDGTIDLFADATVNQSGRFKIEGGELHFEVKGWPAKLVPKPDLIGQLSGGKVLLYKKDCAHAATQYAPNPSDVAALKAQSKEVRVLIYFGTWCPTCSRLVCHGC